MTKRIFSMALAIIFVVSMALPALAAESKNIKITAKYSDTITYNYTLPNISKTETLKTAPKEDKDKWTEFETGCAFAGKEVTVYTIKKGEKIYLKDVATFWVWKMEYKDSVLSAPANPKLDYSKIYKTNYNETKTKVTFTNGRYGTSASYMGGSEKTYMSFSKTGYYAFLPYAGWSPYDANGAKMMGLKARKVDCAPKFGGVVLKVVD